MSIEKIKNASRISIRVKPLLFEESVIIVSQLSLVIMCLNHYACQLISCCLDIMVESYVVAENTPGDCEIYLFQII